MKIYGNITDEAVCFTKEGDGRVWLLMVYNRGAVLESPCSRSFSLSYNMMRDLNQDNITKSDPRFSHNGSNPPKMEDVKAFFKKYFLKKAEDDLVNLCKKFKL